MLATLIQSLLASNSVSPYSPLVTIAQKLVAAHEGSFYLLKQGRLTRAHTSSFTNLEITAEQEKVYIKVIHSGNPRLIKGEDLICIPLKCGSSMCGIIVMRLLKHKKVLSRKEQEALKIFSSIACIAIKQFTLKKELKQAKKNQESMVNNTAHNLRTPLTSLEVYVRLFKKHETNKQKLLWLRRIASASKRLSLVADELVSKHVLNLKHGS